MTAILTSKSAWIGVLLAACLAGIAGWQREPVLAWYYVRQLTSADQESREDYAKKLVLVGEAAAPRLVDGLRDPDAITCDNMRYALVLIAKHWGPIDPRSQQLAKRLHVHFAEFSSAGQEKAVLTLAAMLQMDGPRPLPPRLTNLASDILVTAEKDNNLRPAALVLAAELVDSVQPGQWVDVCREMAERGIADERGNARVAALHLLLRAPMRSDKELLQKAIPLAKDRSAIVRKAALLVLASDNDLVTEDYLLPLLHDEDIEVQDLCETALRKRGLSDVDIRMGRMVSDSNPIARMRVLFYFHRAQDLNVGAWLRRLSLDSEPAVRAAAVRATAEYLHVDLSDRLREMAEHDPCETVRQNAEYFWRHNKARAALD